MRNMLFKRLYLFFNRNMQKGNNSSKNFFNYDLNTKIDFLWSSNLKKANILVS